MGGRSAMFGGEAQRSLAPPPMGQGLAVLAVLAAALLFAVAGVGGYLLSARIAQARAEIARLDRATTVRRADIDRLNRDYEIRSRLPQLDRWRTPLGLAPTSAIQFVDDGASLSGTAATVRRSLDARRGAAPPPTPAYSPAARARLDDLIATIATR